MYPSFVVPTPITLSQSFYLKRRDRMIVEMSWEGVSTPLIMERDRVNKPGTHKPSFHTRSSILPTHSSQHFACHVDLNALAR